jgi:hypothetical protein
MTSVYNLLREACGISQLEAAERVHDTRLDTVKSWSSDRRPAPGWAINQMQSQLRRIRRAGEDYAAQIKKTAQGNVFVIGLAHDDDDARACGFPSVSAQLQATAIAISLLPDDADIRLVPRVRGAIPAPTMAPDKVEPTETDRKVLMGMIFQRGIFLTQGNVNRRKYERLEDIGWVKGIAVGLSDVEYHITAAGKEARQIRPGDHFRFPNDDRLYRALRVKDGRVTLVDVKAEFRQSQAYAVDIDNCWVDV